MYNTVSLFGHRRIDSITELESKLEPVIRELIKSKPYVDFLIGREGEFDQLAAGIIRRVCRQLDYGNTHLTLVLPYMIAEYRDNEEYYLDYYDDVEVCTESASAHFKAAIQLRNRSLIDCSDLVVCYVTGGAGGAYRALQYALSRGVRVINLAELYQEN
ncbi:MAG: hypothetical protein IJ746_06635 [Ruminococcus sp.]|nr:hypothetical protein [Ruminococcus sp.]